MNLAQRKLARGEHDVQSFVEAAADAAARAANLTARLLAFPGSSHWRRRSSTPIALSPACRTFCAARWATRSRSKRCWRAVSGKRMPTRARSRMPSSTWPSTRAMPWTKRASSPSRRPTVVSTRPYAAAHPEVKAGQYVMIAVTDTGAGMSPDIMAQAFEPFFTTKPAAKGTGLGLSRVFGFVKQSGGPRFTGPEEATGAARSDVPQTETVLLVEDDARVRASTAATLLELGYTVIEAASGEEALRKLGENAAIALMLTDIVMPGMNGRELAEQARKHSRSLKVVFMTGFTRNAAVHNGVLDHDVHFIAKPFTLEQLTAKLRAVRAQPE